MKIERLGVDALSPGESLRPLRDQVIVKIIDFGWSDIIQETYHGTPVRGEVVAVGPGTYPYLHERGTRDDKRFHTVKESKQFRPTEVKPGQIVHLGGLENGGYSFQRVNIAGADHVICTEKDICGIEHG